MFDAWRKKARREEEAKWFQQIRARDADVGVPSKDTMTDRLRKAAIDGMWEVVDDCLRKGANVNEELEVSKNWATAKYFAPLRKLGGLGYYSEREVPLLCMAVMHKDVKATANLLAQGANPSLGYTVWDSYYFSPLMIAVHHKSPDMVKLLCDGGADLTSDRPLRLAEEKGYSDIIKIIRAEEAKRAGGPVAVAPPPPPATPVDKVLEAIENLSRPEREKLLAIVNEKFARPKPADSELAQDVVVPKTISLKVKAQPDV